MSGIYTYRYWIAGTLVLFTVLATFFHPRLKSENHITQFLSGDDPEYAYFKVVQKELEYDSKLLFVSLSHSPDIYDAGFLKQADKLLSSLDTLPHLRSVSGLTRSSYPTRSLMGIISVPYFILDDGDTPAGIREKIERDKRYADTYTNPGRTALLVYLELKPELSRAEIDSTIFSIQNILGAWPENSTHIWGKEYVRFALDDIARREMYRSLGLGFLFLAVVLLFLLRRWQGVVAIIMVVLSVAVLFYGILAALGISTNLMTNLLPTIILISGVSDIIHLSVRAQKGFEAGQELKEICSSTLREVGRAIFVTSATTALGFFSLLLTPIPVIRQFGVHAGMAVLLTFVLIVLLFPLLMSFRGKPLLELRPKVAKASRVLLGKLYETQRNKPRQAVAWVLVLLVASAFGIGNINTNNRQYSMPDSGELRMHQRFFEEEFGGSRTVELYVESKGVGDLLQPDLFNRIHVLHSALDSLPFLNRVTSPISVYRQVQRGYHLSDIRRDFNKSEIDRYTSFLGRGSSLSYLMNEERNLLKFRGQMKDGGRLDAAQKYREIASTAEKVLAGSEMNARINGLDYLYDRTHAERIRHMLTGLLLAIGMVTVILGSLFRNFRLALAALLLNLIPIILGAGVMGLTGYELRAGTSIVFTIAFVIAVDDTIHLLSKYQWERKKGASLETALRASVHQCGSAILTTSAILAGAFLILMTSALEEIAAFGFLTAAILVIAFFADILLLPILVRVLGK